MIENQMNPNLINKNSLLLIIILCLIISCNKNNDSRNFIIKRYEKIISVDDKYYNINFIINSVPSLPKFIPYSQFVYFTTTGIDKTIEGISSFQRIAKEKEIFEFPARIKVLKNKVLNCLIVVDLKNTAIKNHYKAFYICWENSADENWPDIVNWDIGKSTKLIVTNLPKVVICNLFSEFKGNIIRKYFKQINFNLNLNFGHSIYIDNYFEFIE